MVNFASTRYTSAFENLPEPDRNSLRQSTLDYLASFDPSIWYKDPITSLYLGQKLQGGGTSVVTKDALGKANGTQYYATSEQISEMKHHICTFQSPHNDLRSHLRAIETELLTTYVGLLIGNQCLDFQKQDGITEIEEAIMANAVERRFNDMLLEDEMAGMVRICRRPIYVSCVSNFTNFLDLFRKTVRSLELGIPCVVLGRSNNAQQHSYRWSLLLMELLFNEHGTTATTSTTTTTTTCHPGMFTFLSASLNDIKDVTVSCQPFSGNLYATCSRALASDIRNGYANLVASTGGPNTLITTEWTESVRNAIRMSATIESSGQCTALRHCVVPSTISSDHIEAMFNKVEEIPDAVHALQSGVFDGIFAGHEGSAPPNKDDNYLHNDKRDVYFHIDDKPPQDNIQEYWRKVVIDFSRLDLESNNNNKEEVEELAMWLNRHQPISLAVNTPRSHGMELGRLLFEKTGLVVYTLGSTDAAEAPPAMTCQARPQEGEIFGEFPPRAELAKYTKYPVIVPSSTPSYDTEYQPDYLNTFVSPHVWGQDIENMLNDIESNTVRGYCNVLLDYLRDATQQNPKLGFGKSRTALWGLQRPPLGSKTCIRCNIGVNSWDDVAPTLLLFYATNARDQVEVSLDSTCSALLSKCMAHGIDHILQDERPFSDRAKGYYNIVRPSGPMTTFPLTGLFVSLCFPLGHIKSTKPDDKEFVATLGASAKWLKSYS